MRLAPCSSSCCSDGRRRAGAIGSTWCARCTSAVEPMALPRVRDRAIGTVEGRTGTLLVARPANSWARSTSPGQLENDRTGDADAMLERCPTSALPATGGTRSSCRTTRASRSSSTSTPRTTRRAARPKARNSAICTRQFRKAGATVVGVSRDIDQVARRLQGQDGVSVRAPLGPDEKLCAQFDVIKMKNMYGKQVRGIERSTFLIDREGNSRASGAGSRSTATSTKYSRGSFQVRTHPAMAQLEPSGPDL